MAVEFDRFCNHSSQLSVWAVFRASSLGISPRISCILNSSPACPTMGCGPSGFTMKRHRCVTQPHRLIPGSGRSLPSNTRGPQHCLGCWQQCRSNNLNLNAIMNLKWGTFALMSASRAIAVATCYNPLRNVQSGSVPCNPTAVVSMCCWAEDYCLSNNVRFNGFRCNLLSTKGCTDPK
jgi:hypothetical protein